MGRILSLFAVLALAGCDSFHGVWRETKMETGAPHQCVRQVLEQTTGIENISYVLAGEKAEFQHHFYGYEYEGLRVRLAVLDNRSGRTITQIFAQNRITPPQWDIDSIRPLMAEVERNIAMVCSPNRSMVEVKEECRKVKCGPLPPSGVQSNPSLSQSA